MANPSKRRGTSWESLVVDFLVSHGWKHAERRALNGAKDRGDIAGLPGLVIECKSANRLELAAWVDETEVERTNDGARFGVTFIKRRGRKSPEHGYVVMTGASFVALLKEAGW